MKILIEFKNLSFGYSEKNVLNDFSFSVQAGETAIFSGDNGSGKSTALKIINGLIFPASGKYLFNNEEITEKKMRDVKFSKSLHQKIGFVFQNPDVQLFTSTVFDELAFAPRQMNFSEEEIFQRVSDALKFLEIEHLRERTPYSLSGGEKRRVAVASVLTMNPTVWTLDEPETFLDSKGRAWLLEFLQALKAAGKTLIISSHDKIFQKSLADKIITF